MFDTLKVHSCFKQAESFMKYFYLFYFGEQKVCLANVLLYKGNRFLLLFKNHKFQNNNPLQEQHAGIVAKQVSSFTLLLWFCCLVITDPLYHPSNITLMACSAVQNLKCDPYLLMHSVQWSETIIDQREIWKRHYHLEFLGASLNNWKKIPIG